MAGKNILLVEGSDDEHVVRHLCDYHGLLPHPSIANLGGVEKLIDSFPTRLKESDVHALGVLVDADTNLQARWQSLLPVRCSRVIKTAFLVTLFNDAFYVMESEPAVERRYADLLLRVRPDMRQYALLDHLLEFRTVSLKAVGLTTEELAATPRATLRTLPAVAEQILDAERQLAACRAVLERTAGATLKLRTHTVVGIGLERLVW